MNLVIALLRGIKTPWIKWSIAGAIACAIAAGVFGGVIEPSELATYIATMATL
ncbi:hypothetical protein [Aeromonas popoffii]|uniref:hypothetical protein n=1 Tax=Aeromonas popoffii TaxID=70856 RepID=UPI0030D10C5B